MALTSLLIWVIVKSSTDPGIVKLTFTQFSHEIAQSNVREVTVTGSANAGIFHVQGVLKKGNVIFRTAAPANYTDWLRALTEDNAGINFEISETNTWLTWLANVLPIILVLGLWVFIMRSMQKSSRRIVQTFAGPDKP